MTEFLDRFFKLKQNGTSVRTEVIAGITTFAAMSYILIVNPAILSEAGMDTATLITVTALAAAVGTILLAFLTNYPLAMAPGMGLNAFFAYTICIGMGIPWQAALALVFYNGILFLALSFTGLRSKIADSIPHSLKVAITCGIGLFIAFIGFKNAGIIVASDATFVTIGDLSSPVPLLILFGVFITLILVGRKIPGAILISILIISIIGLFVPASEDGSTMTSLPSEIISMPKGIEATFFALDFMYPLENILVVWPIILSLLFVDLFDTLGTLIGVSNRAGLLDENGRLPKMGKALTADASATIIGALLGTSTSTTYVESAAGVEEGGRTGLTALVVAACFLLAIFFTPLILAVPATATAPALIVVGIFMMQGASELDLSDFTIAAPAVITMLIMPLAFSISEGIALGIMAFVFLMAGLGRFREIHPIAWVLAILFLLYYLFIGL